MTGIEVRRIAPARRRPVAALLGALVLAGCGAIARVDPPPGRVAETILPLGIENARFWFDSNPEAFLREARLMESRQAAALPAGRRAGLPPSHLLALSGGGDNGAFGAGLMVGWTESGRRPSFDLVTGISAGALIAPFAFLGSSHDRQLREVYTGLTLADVATSRGLLNAIFSDGLADNAPLLRTISRYMNEAMLAGIARGYGEGRLLLIGTTQLDAQLPVIWNIGAIAASGHPGALDLCRRILLASAAIPGAFSPVMFDVKIGNESFQEMHVDGGTFAQAFLYPAALGRRRQERIRRGVAAPVADAFVIRNARLDPEWADVERRTLGIAGRAISTLIAANGYNDVIRIYNNTQRDGIGFHLAYIGRDFAEELPAPFDQAYMRALFRHGYDRARAGFNWARRPPA